MTPEGTFQVKNLPAHFNPLTATGRIYIRHKNDHPGGQRTYIYVVPQFRFYAFGKARPPTWLLLHVSEVSSSSVRWSLFALLGLVHWENSCSMLRTVFVQMERNSVVDVPRCNTSWYDLYVWWLSWRRRSRRELVSSCWKWVLRGRRWRLAGRWNCWRGHLGEKKTTPLAELLGTKTSMFQLTVNARLRRGIVGMNVRASSRVKHSEPAVRRTSKQERRVRMLVKHQSNTWETLEGKNPYLHHCCFLCSVDRRRACKNFDERRRSGNTRSDGVRRFPCQTGRNRNFGAIICLD